MPARSLCQKFLKKILSPLHHFRQNTFIEVASVVICGASFTLTSIGRHLQGFVE